MLRLCIHLRRVSPFSLYAKHLGSTGVLKGVKKPNDKAAKMYAQLTTPEKKIFVDQAKRKTYPALDAFNRFQKKYAHRFAHLPNRQRQRMVGKLWAELKQKGSVKIPKGVKTARRKVKKTAKTIHKRAKTLKRASKTKKSK